MKHFAALSIAALALSTFSSAAPADPPAGGSGLRVVSKIAGPDGGWDYASFDPAHRRLYVAHSTVVLALDADSGKLKWFFQESRFPIGFVKLSGLRVMRSHDDWNLRKFRLLFYFSIEQEPVGITGLDIKEDKVGQDRFHQLIAFRIGAGH